MSSRNIGASITDIGTAIGVAHSPVNAASRAAARSAANSAADPNGAVPDAGESKENISGTPDLGDATIAAAGRRTLTCINPAAHSLRATAYTGPTAATGGRLNRSIGRR